MSPLTKVLAAGVLLGTSFLSVAYGLPRTQSPEDAEIFIVSPLDNAVVDQTFTIKFGVKGMQLAKAGEGKAEDMRGHFHLLVDTPEGELPDMNFILPTTDKLIHFGMAQTETELTLAPGTHTLQLLMGDRLHIPHLRPVISKMITVTVE